MPLVAAMCSSELELGHQPLMMQRVAAMTLDTEGRTVEPLVAGMTSSELDLGHQRVAAMTLDTGHWLQSRGALQQLLHLAATNSSRVRIGRVWQDWQLGLDGATPLRRMTLDRRTLRHLSLLILSLTHLLLPPCLYICSV
jgi:hypothetical protein